MTFLEKGGKEKGLFSVIANIFVSFIGGGVLGLPYAFKEVSIIIIIGHIYTFGPHTCLCLELS